MQENMKNREREIKVLADALKKFPKIYTIEDIEAAEAGYWNKRLTRQMSEDMISAQTGINQGNIRAAIEANTSVEQYLLGFKQHLLDQFNPQQIQNDNLLTK